MKYLGALRGSQAKCNARNDNEIESGVQYSCDEQEVEQWQIDSSVC